MKTVNIAEMNFNAYVLSCAEGTPKPLVVMGFLSDAYSVPLNHISLVGMTGTFRVKGLDHACQLTSEIRAYLAPARQAYPVKKVATPKQVQQAAKDVATIVHRATAQAAATVASAQQQADDAVVRAMQAAGTAPQPEPHLFDFLVGEAARVLDRSEESILEALAPALPEPTLGEILEEQRNENKAAINGVKPARRKTVKAVLK